MDASSNLIEKALDRQVQRLHARGRPRVWSVVITVFGDAIVPRAGRVPLSVLQDLMARLSIEPGALRTAMSRLAADGWVKREREGRNSFFRLAEGGRHAFDLASRRIYASEAPRWDGGWTVAIAPPDCKPETAEDLLAAGFMRMSDNVFLRPDTDGAPTRDSALDGMLVIQGTSAEHPEMLRHLWPSEDIANAYRAFIEHWSPIQTAVSNAPPPAPLDAMATRTLLVHDWRRIVLRDHGLPPALLPRDWPGEDARAVMQTIYRHLGVPSEAWLDTAGLPSNSRYRRSDSRFTTAGTD